MPRNAKLQSSNRILRRLPKPVQARIIQDCERMQLNIRHVLYEANKPISGVYFPLSGVISLVAQMDNGSEIEVATTGNEGMIGLPLFLGAHQTPLQCFAQVKGESLHLPATLFRKHLAREPELVAILHRFAQALMMQISISTACNRAHRIDQRCCRWLLMTHDRVTGDEFVLTQEFLAQMLGVRRATVGEVAAELQKAKLIQYNRGVMRIVDRRRLEKRSCGCYVMIRDEYERLLRTRRK